jgi:hypothetical protein
VVLLVASFAFGALLAFVVDETSAFLGALFVAVAVDLPRLLADFAGAATSESAARASAQRVRIRETIANPFSFNRIRNRVKVKP